MVINVWNCINVVFISVFGFVDKVYGLDKVGLVWCFLIGMLMVMLVVVFMICCVLCGLFKRICLCVFWRYLYCCCCLLLVWWLYIRLIMLCLFWVYWWFRFLSWWFRCWRIIWVRKVRWFWWFICWVWLIWFIVIMLRFLFMCLKVILRWVWMVSSWWCWGWDRFFMKG